MHKLISFSLLLAAFTCMSNSSCTKDSVDKLQTADFGSKFEIRVDEAVVLPKRNKELLVSLTSVSDSRCPKNVQCIHAGQVITKLSVAAGEETGHAVDLCLGQCGDTLNSTDTASLVLNNTRYSFILHEVSSITSTLAVLEVRRE